MSDLADMRRMYEDRGYSTLNATARVCQDVVLSKIAGSPLNRNLTVKGGVLMCAVTKNRRRATQDIDLDLVSYPIEDGAIERLVRVLSDVDDGIDVRIEGPIVELSQQEYKGKRVQLVISDGKSAFTTKLDLGVHASLDMEQEERWFDIAQDDEGVSLLANSEEQMFVEKLKSLLRHGIRSTRYRDLHDMYFLGHDETLDRERLKSYIRSHIVEDKEMWDVDIEGIAKRVERTLSNKPFQMRMKNSQRSWSDIESIDIVAWLPRYLRSL